ncbi:MAG: hypothetical protein KAX80_07005, partial [Planctomycetes bacterium]|nr:hypothetical protein [Planctomycetota bacterium]
VTDLVPESRKSVSVGTITCAESDGDVPEPLPGYLTLDVLGHSYQCEISEDGSLAESLDLRLVEGKISLRLDRGTFCLDRNDNPLDYLSVTRDTSPPTCESGSVLDAYKLRPNGATFDPYLELDLKYDREDLPEDAEEDELYIGYYDRDADSWVALESQVDSTESIVMTDVEHFTTFGTIAETSSAPPPPPPPPPPAPAPASFVLSNFSISPTQVEPGRPVSISVDVTNVGGTEGNYTLDLLINGVLQNSREITLAPQESKTVSYQVGRTGEGAYTVTLDGQSGQFTVLAASSGDSAAPDSTPQSPSSPSFLSWLSRHWLLVMIVVYFLVFI